MLLILHHFLDSLINLYYRLELGEDRSVYCDILNNSVFRLREKKNLLRLSNFEIFN